MVVLVVMVRDANSVGCGSGSHSSGNDVGTGDTSRT